MSNGGGYCASWRPAPTEAFGSRVGEGVVLACVVNTPKFCVEAEIVPFSAPLKVLNASSVASFEDRLPGESPVPPRVSASRYLRGGRIKRCLDLLVASAGLLVLSPCLLLLTILIKKESSGSALIRKQRIGKHFRPFFLLRFRTRFPAARRGGKLDQAGVEKLPPPAGDCPFQHDAAHPVQGAEGLTRVGAFLRRWRLDGVPQLLNVLRGDMSLVGPRPETWAHIQSHKKDLEALVSIRPGIVDLADIRRRGGAGLPGGSLSGGPVEDEKQYIYVHLPQSIRHGMEYLSTASLGLDLMLLGLSVVTRLQGAVGPWCLEAFEAFLKQVMPYRRAIVVLVQAGLLILTNFLAFLVRFDGDLPRQQEIFFARGLPVLFLLRIAGFVPFGLFAGLWRYVGTKDLRNIMLSVGLSSLAFFLVTRHWVDTLGYSRSVIVIDSLLLIFALAGIRMLKRMLRAFAGRRPAETRLLIIGAGDAGEMLLREIEMHSGYAYRPMGFIDDDPAKAGTRIRGVRVLGTRKELARIIETHRPDGLLIAISAAPPEVLQEIVRSCRKFGLPVKCVPGLRDLLTTRGMLLDTIRDVEPEDLLCRPPVALSSPELKESYRGKSILVTGAGGSIGGELVRQLARLEPGCLVLYERHEHSLYLIEMELRRLHPQCPIVPVIGDILDGPRLSSLLRERHPSLLFHAAAYKHVPMMESNPQEAVKVNILGTKNVAQLALKHSVERFVFISSDKAVNPSNVMGATKRVGELILQDLVEEGRTRFMAVRFGNVLESSGSVVPLFKEQIRRGGPITITHPEIARYFMTTAEAAHLVLNAAILGDGGEIFVLDMGQPVKILDMARQLISLYGHEPGRDIEIVFTGLRPGEKMHEELTTEDEQVCETRHPKIFRIASDRPHAGWQFPEHLSVLEDVALTGMGVSELTSRLGSFIKPERTSNVGVLDETRV